MQYRSFKASLLDRMKVYKTSDFLTPCVMITVQLLYREDFFSEHTLWSEISGNLCGPPSWGFFFCWFYKLRKILETCTTMTFRGFQRQVKWCQSFFFYKNVPESWCKRKLEYYTTHGYMMCTLMPWHFNVIFRGKPLRQNMTTETLCEESSYTMTWYEEKTDLKRGWRFLRTNKSSPLKITFCGYNVQNLYAMYVSLRRSILLWKWLKMYVGK